MTNKTFNVAGLSTLNGVVKVRFANDLAGRIKVLSKNEHADIRLIDLGSELTKFDCAKAILAHKDFKDADAQTVISAYIAKNTITDGTPKVKKTATPKAVKAKSVATPAHKTKAGNKAAEVKAKDDTKVEEFSTF
jgi:hypothetical protein